MLIETTYGTTDNTELSKENRKKKNSVKKENAAFTLKTKNIIYS